MLTLELVGFEAPEGPSGRDVCPLPDVWGLKLGTEARAAGGDFQGISVMMGREVLGAEELAREEGERERRGQS